MSENAMTMNVDQFADVEGIYEERPKGGGTYLSIFDFMICQRSKSFAKKEDAEANLTALQAVEDGWIGPHERTNPKTKQPVFSNSKPYDRLIGRIADMSKHTKEFSADKGGGRVTNWDITFLVGGKRLTLQLTYMDSVLKRFLKVLPNVDLRRPLLISAFKAMKNGEPKQAVAFKQYRGDLNDQVSLRNVDKWDKVEEYWRGQYDEKGNRLEGSVAKGADGTILPQPIQDPEDDSWDYKEQNKFLARYFKDNILPKIKELAEQYGIKNEDTDTSVPEFSGPSQDDTPVTTRPFDPVAKNMMELASGAHVARVKQLCQALNMDPDFACQKLMATNLSELSDEACRYAIYKLETHLAKNPSTAVAPVPVPTPAPVVKPTPPPETDDDLWDIPVTTPETPATAVATPLTGAQEFAQAINPTKGPPDEDDIAW